MSKTFIFFPDFTPDDIALGKEHCRSVMKFGRNKKINPQDSWRAPEHGKLTSDMIRDYPKNSKGERMKDKPRELVMDNRPTIMKPERKPIYLA